MNKYEQEADDAWLTVLCTAAEEEFNGYIQPEGLFGNVDTGAPELPLQPLELDSEGHARGNGATMGHQPPIRGEDGSAQGGHLPHALGEDERAFWEELLTAELSFRRLPAPSSYTDEDLRAFSEYCRLSFPEEEALGSARVLQSGGGAPSSPGGESTQSSEDQWEFRAVHPVTEVQENAADQSFLAGGGSFGPLREGGAFRGL